MIRTKIWGEYNTFTPPSPQTREAEGDLPSYIVLYVNEAGDGSGRFGDVLVPSLSRQTPASERESLARRIAEKEHINHMCLYSTKDAYQANVSGSYQEAHPNALRDGFLGVVDGDKWTLGEALYPATNGETKAPIDSSETRATEKRPLRKWTSSAGTQIDARLISVTGDKIKLERDDGRQIDLTLDQLSEHDQEFIKSLFR